MEVGRKLKLVLKKIFKPACHKQKKKKVSVCLRLEFRMFRFSGRISYKKENGHIYI